MSYSFSFQQFPTKEFEELWRCFLTGNLSQKIKEQIEKLEKEQELIKDRQKDFPPGTWETHREEWTLHRKDGDRSLQNRDHVDNWKRIQKRMEAHARSLKETKSALGKEKIIKKVIEEFLPLFGEQNPYAPRILFVKDCIRFSDSARSNAYIFLKQLFLKVRHQDLEKMKTMPKLEEWIELYNALVPTFFEKEFMLFCREEGVSEQDQERVRNECLELLFSIKDLIKNCREKGWDLWFSSEFQNTDLEKKQRKLLAEKCLDASLE